MQFIYFSFFFKHIFQLNNERTTLRRSPQSITSLLPEYDETKFNFNRVHADEILFECINQTQHDSKQLILSFLINNSPLTPYHSLLCPNLLENRPQVLTKEAILSACHILFGFADQKYHIGFNSPGAFASVNHLHLHLLYIETPLSIQNYVRKRLYCHLQLNELNAFSVRTEDTWLDKKCVHRR